MTNNNKKVPLRTCIISRESLPKKDLLRIVRMPDGTVSVDLTGKQNGRGAYIKKDLQILTKAKKSKQLERHLTTSIPEEIYQQLEDIISDAAEDI